MIKHKQNLTIFSWWNLLPTIVLAITVPLIMYFLHPKPEETVTIDQKLLTGGDEIVGGSHASQDSTTNQERTFSEKIENSGILNYIFTIVGFLFIIRHFYKNGFDLDIDISYSYFPIFRHAFT